MDPPHGRIGAFQFFQHPLRRLRVDLLAFHEDALEGFEIERGLNVEPSAPGRGPYRGLLAPGKPAVGGAALILGMDGVGKDHHFVGSQPLHQGVVLGDERLLQGHVGLRGDMHGFPVLEPPSRRISLAAPEGL